MSWETRYVGCQAKRDLCHIIGKWIYWLPSKKGLVITLENGSISCQAKRDMSYHWKMDLLAAMKKGLVMGKFIYWLSNKKGLVP